MAIITHFIKLKFPEFFQFNSNIYVGIFALMVLGMGQKRNNWYCPFLHLTILENSHFISRVDLTKLMHSW